MPPPGRRGLSSDSVTPSAFESSLLDEAPPPELDPALVGVWHALRAEWDRAHDAVQLDTAPCAWVHAALHREEGDLPNADYWYRKAGRARASGSSADEYRVIAQTLLADHHA